jgi:hypothetical protein
VHRSCIEYARVEADAEAEAAKASRQSFHIWHSCGGTANRGAFLPEQLGCHVNKRAHDESFVPAARGPGLLGWQPGLALI